MNGFLFILVLMNEGVVCCDVIEINSDVIELSSQLTNCHALMVMRMMVILMMKGGMKERKKKEDT